MSALYVTCPKCGPLFTFIPQGGQFTVDIKCPCGIKLTHTENCNNSQPAKELIAKFAKQKGIIPVCSLNPKTTENEQGSLLNECMD